MHSVAHPISWPSWTEPHGSATAVGYAVGVSITCDGEGPEAETSDGQSSTYKQHCNRGQVLHMAVLGAVILPIAGVGRTMYCETKILSKISDTILPPVLTGGAWSATLWPAGQT